MPFARPTLDQLIDRIVNDLTTRLDLPGPPLRRSVVGALARVDAAAVHLLHGHLDYLSNQILPDTAESEYLERWANLFALTRVPAAPAAGNVIVTGTNDIDIPEGTSFQRADGSTYTSTEDATIAGGTATVPVEADAPGVLGDTDAAVVLTFVSPVAGANASATVDGDGLTGGADTETDDELRTRLLARLQAPPQGGSEDDYIAWAKTVAGVTRVWVSPLALGPGTVTVRFVRDDDGDGSAIIPDSDEVQAVQDAIDAVRPVTADVTVVAPVADALDFTLSVTPDSDDIRAAVEANLVDLLARIAEPGGTIPLSQIRTAIGIADGVEDYDLTSPSADVTHATGHIAVIGDVTWA